MSQTSKDSPRPIDTVVDEGQSEAFIPYPSIGKDLEHVPIEVRPDAYYYQARMGFMPNAIKLYLHTPWIAGPMFRFNNALMRDERNSLDEHLKYRLSMVASQTNGCAYCTAHHVCTLKRRWGYDDARIAEALDPDGPHDEREAAAMEFVRQASLDSTAVSDGLRAKLAAHFTPGEIMEIVLVIGFWKMYNTMHNAMNLPIEDPAIAYANWVNYGRQA